jgi:glycosyltransferase involved in cell wall biosynthesis
MTPRIAFVDQTGAIGGAELVLLDIAEAYAASCTVFLFAEGPFSGLLHDRGVDVHIVNMGGHMVNVRRESGLLSGVRSMASVVLGAFRLAGRLREYDLVYANSQKAAVIGGLAARLCGKKMIWHLHDIVSEEHFSPFQRKVITMVLRSFTQAVIANSQASAASIAGLVPSSCPVQVVHPGIDSAAFDAVSEEDAFDLRNKMKLSGHPLAGVFSRLSPWKGQDVMLTSMCQLPELHVIMIADALFGESDYANTLKLTVKELGLSDRVHFIEHTTQIPLYMKMVDYIVSPSVAPEPFGRIIVEGMLAGRPVVATRAGGVTEIIEHGRTGLLVPCGDPKALASALQSLIDDPAACRTMASEAKSVALSAFSKRLMLRRITDILIGFARENRISV